MEATETFAYAPRPDHRDYTELAEAPKEVPRHNDGVAATSDRSLYAMRSLTFSQCTDLRSEDGCDMRRFRSFNHSTCKTVLNLLEAVYLGLRKIEVERERELQYSSSEWTIEAAMVLAVLESR